jgi:hypothetical protein
VRARNVYGFGPFSEMTSILASTRPSAPEQVTTTTIGLNVMISFPPAMDNGDPIKSYTIEIL